MNTGRVQIEGSSGAGIQKRRAGAGRGVGRVRVGDCGAVSRGAVRGRANVRTGAGRPRTASGRVRGGVGSGRRSDRGQGSWRRVESERGRGVEGPVEPPQAEADRDGADVLSVIDGEERSRGPAPWPVERVYRAAPASGGPSTEVRRVFLRPRHSSEEATRLDAPGGSSLSWRASACAHPRTEAQTSGPLGGVTFTSPLAVALTPPRFLWESDVK